MANALLVLGLLTVGLVLTQVSSAIVSMFAGLRRERQQREYSRLEWLERVERAHVARARQTAAGAAWNGFRKFVVHRKEVEAEGICSFYLVPHDGKRLPPFDPGQFLTFQLSLPGQNKPILRCYSLSDSPLLDYYRVSIKRVYSPPDAPEAPPGQGSNYFHDHVDQGDFLDVKAPNGRFVLDSTSSHPAVLVGGGVGITPMLSMINFVAESGSDREVILFYGARNGAEQVQGQHLIDLDRNYPNIRVVTVYSSPTEADLQSGRKFETGRISAELMRKYLETSNYHFYVCGPPMMMKTLLPDLEAWGVPKSHIFTEAFGPASVKARVEPPPRKEEDEEDSDSSGDKTASSIKVSFAKSGKELNWNSRFSNLLEFAGDHGIEISSSCCAGSCGTCEIAIKSGKVDYDEEPEHAAGDGCCLACVGRPATDVVLDA